VNVSSRAPVLDAAGRSLSLRAATPWISLGARLVLAVVFAVAGWPKLTDPDGTLRSVRAFRLVPEAVVPAFGYALPALELVLALLLLVGLVTRLAAAGVGVLLVMFIVGISAAWARGLSIDCGCFGTTGATVTDPVRGYVLDLVRDLALLALACWLVARPRSRFSADRWIGLGPSA
jgi:uncharacterized membrane protein YphA (DoxX/SURF4 family)